MDKMNTGTENLVLFIKLDVLVVVVFLLNTSDHM